VPKLPLFEIRAAIADRMITTFFFPPPLSLSLSVSLQAPKKSLSSEGPRQRGGRWAGADGDGSPPAAGGGRGDDLGLGFRGDPMVPGP
jgi:hypothetical protein